MINVTLSSGLARLNGNQTNASFEAPARVEDLLKSVAKRYPSLRQVLIDDDGRPRAFLGVIIDGETVDVETSPNRLVQGGSNVWLMTAIAGG